MSTLSFTLEGSPPSGNRSARMGSRMYTPRDVTEYRERIASVTMAEMRRQKFRMPEYVSIEITAYNIRTDADNLCAEIFDGMQGIAFPFDSRIIDLHVLKRRDKAVTRVAIRVEGVDGKAAGYR